MSQCCITCHFWNRILETDIGACRVRPPVIVHAVIDDSVKDGHRITSDMLLDATCFPHTMEDDWCGEFKKEIPHVEAH